MEFRAVKSFLEVARQKSFCRAAEKLGYTQAAVTIQIKQLEEELGVKLFDRIGKQTFLSNSGQLFYDYALKMVNDSKEAQQVLSSQKKEPTGPLTIGTIDSICSTVLPNFVQEFHLMFPKVNINVIVDTPKALFNKLNSNEIDLIYYLDEIRIDQNLVIAFSKKEEAVFVSPSQFISEISGTTGAAGTTGTSGAALEANQTDVSVDSSIDEILSEPLILTEKGASYRFLLEQHLLSLGKKVKPIIETGNTEFILNMLKRNLGISFLPKFMVEDQIKRGKLFVVNVKDFSIPVWQQIIYHKDKYVGRKIKSFIQIVKNHFPPE
ncbi:MAG: LysR family transcriptional regulator [Treponema sp.]|nr:LysR family transcriptional regulator [Treponema sp.]